MEQLTSLKTDKITAVEEASPNVKGKRPFG